MYRSNRWQQYFTLKIPSNMTYSLVGDNLFEMVFVQVKICVPPLKDIFKKNAILIAHYVRGESKSQKYI